MASEATLDEAHAAKAAVLAAFRRRATVVGVGITRIGPGYGVKVNLESTPADDDALPDRIGGVSVRIEVVGAIRKH